MWSDKTSKSGGPFRSPAATSFLTNTFATAKSCLGKSTCTLGVVDVDGDSACMGNPQRRISEIVMLRKLNQRIKPMDNFQKAKVVSSVDFLEDRFVQPPELPPGVARVLVFDLSNDAKRVPMVDQQSVRLAPPLTCLVCEGNPRPVLDLALCHSKRQKCKVVLHLPLISNTNCKAPSRWFSSDKRWLGNEGSPSHLHRSDEPFRWGARALHSELPPG